MMSALLSPTITAVCGKHAAKVRRPIRSVGLNPHHHRSATAGVPSSASPAPGPRGRSEGSRLRRRGRLQRRQRDLTSSIRFRCCRHRGAPRLDSSPCGAERQRGTTSSGSLTAMAPTAGCGKAWNKPAIQLVGWPADEQRTLATGTSFARSESSAEVPRGRARPAERHVLRMG